LALILTKTRETIRPHADQTGLKIQALGSPVATACVHACGQFADLLDRAKQENGLGRLGVHGGSLPGETSRLPGSQEQHVRPPMATIVVKLGDLRWSRLHKSTDENLISGSDLFVPLKNRKHVN
jgi:hypothetical protein